MWGDVGKFEEVCRGQCAELTRLEEMWGRVGGRRAEVPALH